MLFCASLYRHFVCRLPALQETGVVEGGGGGGGEVSLNGMSMCT